MSAHRIYVRKGNGQQVKAWFNSAKRGALPATPTLGVEGVTVLWLYESLWVHRDGCHPLPVPPGKWLVWSPEYGGAIVMDSDTFFRTYRLPEGRAEYATSAEPLVRVWRSIEYIGPRNRIEDTLKLSVDGVGNSFGNLVVREAARCAPQPWNEPLPDVPGYDRHAHEKPGGSMKGARNAEGQAAVDRRAEADPDNPPLTDEQLASATLVVPPAKAEHKPVTGLKEAVEQVKAATDATIRQAMGAPLTRGELDEIEHEAALFHIKRLQRQLQTAHHDRDAWQRIAAERLGRLNELGGKHARQRRQAQEVADEMRRQRDGALERERIERAVSSDLRKRTHELIDQVAERAQENNLLKARVNELLEANNAEVERRRAAERKTATAAKDAVSAFLNAAVVISTFGAAPPDRGRRKADAPVDRRVRNTPGCPEGGWKRGGSSEDASAGDDRDYGRRPGDRDRARARFAQGPRP